MAAKSKSEKKFSTQAAMQKAIDEYFRSCDEREVDVYDKNYDTISVKKPVPYTIEGLCRALGLCRKTLLSIDKQSAYKEYLDIINGAKLKIQQNLIERALDGGNTSFITFILKNNFGYNEKTEAEELPDTNSKITVNVLTGQAPPIVHTEDDIEE